jgi:hypothetical protein
MIGLVSVVVLFVFCNSEVASSALFARRPILRFAACSVLSCCSFAHVSSARSASVSKSVLIEAASMGVSVDSRDKKAMEEIKKSEKARAPAPIFSSNRAISNQNPGGDNKGLASYGSESAMQGKGSLADQLKAFGGPGEVDRVDNSLKKPTERLRAVTVEFSHQRPASQKYDILRMVEPSKGYFYTSY